MKLRVITLLLIISSSLSARTVWIIIHGTWGIDSAWYLPGGDFFEACTQSLESFQDHRCVSFSWNGKNSHEARVRAAQQLQRLIVSYEPETTILIIAHSHGANVAFLATQRLAENPTHRIDTIFALGAPINTEWYAPQMNVVGQIFNFFSLRDLVQPVFGMFERQIQNHERISNVRILVNDRQPMHCGLHAPEIGKWLPHLHAQQRQLTIDGEPLDMSIPMVMKFSMNSYPICEVDVYRNMLMEEDRVISCEITGES